MLTPDTYERVSIFERLVPSLGYTIVAISGAVGGLMVIRFLRALAQAENAGYAAFFGGMSEIEFVVGLVLVVAAVLSTIGILVSVIRLFTTNSTSSPPGVLFLMAGLLSIVPPLALHYVLRLMKDVLLSPDLSDGGISTVADTAIMVSWFAIGSAVLIGFVLLAFSFIPFRSRSGRKALPLVSLMFVQILIAALIGVYFWQARTSIAERDKERDFYPADSNTEQSSDTNDYDGDFENNSNTYQAPANTNAKFRGKTISGGVLNGKAIDLQQPPYPPAARAVRASGSVIVQITVDEKGEVISARAVSGHALLRPAAERTARQTRFTPTKLAGQPVRVTGVLTFNFSAQ